MDWHVRTEALLPRLPGVPDATYPNGVPFVLAMRHGTMRLELFAPDEEDRQQPHEQDELYLVAAGRSRFVRGDERIDCSAGDALFVPAGMKHRFEDFTDDFRTWVVFWGPAGGEEPHRQSDAAPVPERHTARGARR